MIKARNLLKATQQASGRDGFWSKVSLIAEVKLLHILTTFIHGGPNLPEGQDLHSGTVSASQRQWLSTPGWPLSVLLLKKCMRKEVKSEELIESMSLSSTYYICEINTKNPNQYWILWAINVHLDHRDEWKIQLSGTRLCEEQKPCSPSHTERHAGFLHDLHLLQAPAYEGCFILVPPWTFIYRDPGEECYGSCLLKLKKWSKK